MLTVGLVNVIVPSAAAHTVAYHVPAAKFVTVACPLRLAALVAANFPFDPAIYLSEFAPVNVTGVVPVYKLVLATAVAPADDEIPMVLVT